MVDRAVIAWQCAYVNISSSIFFKLNSSIVSVRNPQSFCFFFFLNDPPPPEISPLPPHDPLPICPRAGGGDGFVHGLAPGGGAGRRGARRGPPGPPWPARHHSGDRSRLGAALPERAPPAGGGGRVTLVLEPRHVTAIRRHGEADYPYEACGLIGGAAGRSPAPPGAPPPPPQPPR